MREINMDLIKGFDIVKNGSETRISVTMVATNYTSHLLHVDVELIKDMIDFKEEWFNLSLATCEEIVAKYSKPLNIIKTAMINKIDVPEFITVNKNGLRTVNNQYLIGLVRHKYRPKLCPVSLVFQRYDREYNFKYTYMVNIPPNFRFIFNGIEYTINVRGQISTIAIGYDVKFYTPTEFSNIMLNVSHLLNVKDMYNKKYITDMDMFDKMIQTINNESKHDYRNTNIVYVPNSIPKLGIKKNHIIRIICMTRKDGTKHNYAIIRRNLVSREHQPFAIDVSYLFGENFMDNYITGDGSIDYNAIRNELDIDVQLYHHCDYRNPIIPSECIRRIESDSEKAEFTIEFEFFKKAYLMEYVFADSMRGIGFVFEYVDNNVMNRLFVDVPEGIYFKIGKDIVCGDRSETLRVNIKNDKGDIINICNFFKDYDIKVSNSDSRFYNVILGVNSISNIGSLIKQAYKKTTFLESVIPDNIKPGDIVVIDNTSYVLTNNYNMVKCDLSHTLDKY